MIVDKCACHWEAAMTFWSIRLSSAITSVAIAATATLIEGCSGGQGPAPAVQLEKASITVGDFPTIDSAGLYIAEMDGLFHDQGLNVTVKFAPTSQSAVAGQEAGIYDVSSADYVTYIDSELKASDRLRIIAEASVLRPNQLELLVASHSQINLISELRGKTISVAAPNDIATLLVDSLLSEHGISSSQVRFKPGVPLPVAGADVDKGLAAAAPIPEPFVSVDEQNYGLKELADLNQGATENFPIQGYAVTSAWAKKYPRTLRAFVTAITRGQQIADTNRGAVERAVEKFLRISPETAALIALPEFPLAVDTTQLQRVLDTMVQFGLLPTKDSSFKMATMTG
jgi:NitT/TauT family transport system substrate-binding protein